MKLSDFLFNIGRPVAFYPSLVKALGDRNEAIFICQMAYWRGKGDDNDGWIYKTSDEIEQETSLTYKEQTNVRRGLMESKLLDERYARTEHMMYFRVNWDTVNEKWEQFTDGHMPDGKVASSQRSDATLPEVSSLNSNTETTPETTPEIAAAPLSSEDLQEIEEAANRTVDGILGMNQEAVRREAEGTAWRGRELTPPNYLPYGDWWHSKTNQHMYGKKGKQQVNTEWLKAFKEWWENDLTTDTLDQVFDAEKSWKGVIGKPSELTTKAIALQAMPKTFTPSGPAINKKAIEATKKMLEEKERLQYVPMPKHLQRSKAALSKISDVVSNMFPERRTE